jgi:AP endonuclease-1
MLLCPADVPNAGRGLVTLPKRMKWDPDLRNYVKELDSKKPVILCGDMNVSHQPIGRYIISYLVVLKVCK